MSRQFIEGSGIWWGEDLDGKRQCRGALQGRCSSSEVPSIPARLFRISINSGGYDDGGAYWGCSAYCLRESHPDGKVREWFTNARSRIEAESKLRGNYPSLQLALPSRGRV